MEVLSYWTSFYLCNYSCDVKLDLYKLGQLLMLEMKRYYPDLEMFTGPVRFTPPGVISPHIFHIKM